MIYIEIVVSSCPLITCSYHAASDKILLSGVLHYCYASYPTGKSCTFGKSGKCLGNSAIGNGNHRI